MTPELQPEVLVPLIHWNCRLKDKIDGYKTVEEALQARRFYDAGVSVHLAQKAIEAMRRGIQ